MRRFPGSSERLASPLCCERTHDALPCPPASRLTPLLLPALHPIHPPPPSLKPSGEEDPASTHGSCPTLAGEKWSATRCAVHGRFFRVHPSLLSLCWGRADCHAPFSAPIETTDPAHACYTRAPRGLLYADAALPLLPPSVPGGSTWAPSSRRARPRAAPIRTRSARSGRCWESVSGGGRAALEGGGGGGWRM